MGYEVNFPHQIWVGGTATFYYTSEEELLEDLKKAVKEVEEHLNERGYIVHKDCPC